MELDERKIVILKTIIQNYLETGEPVGSRTISKYSGLNLSSATIRNEMSDLEEMGYILQPHTSAGRIPSDKGYRFYVDSLMADQRSELNEVREQMFQKVDRLEAMLKNLVKSLAVDTNYAALISGPAFHQNKIKYLQVSLVDEHKLLLVVMVEGNIVKTTMVTIPEELEFDSVLGLNLLLNKELGGLSLEEITEGLCAEILRETPYKESCRAVLRALFSTLSLEEEGPQIYTSGATNIFKYPELSESDKASKLISAFEQKDELVELIHDVSTDEGAQIQVYIGEETPIQTMRDCSIVTANYELGNGLRGTIGVIGPKRMDYEKVLGTLRQLMLQMDQAFKR